MPSINNDLLKMLQNVQRPGDFYAAGSREIFAPRLEVEGIGPISLPLSVAQAEQLVCVAERAPYGKGEETLVDTEVRRTWQIDAGKVELGGKHWKQDLAAIVKQVTTDLGVSAKVKVEFYKLLVYDEGGFFVQHRDTEKAAGMFATLVIVLPSNYTGGELVVRHNGQEVSLDLHREEPSEVAFAAFYADCVHEIRPITAGCRLTLVYNLLRTGKQALPKPPNYQAEQQRVTELLRIWAGALIAEARDGSPEKLIYLLEHAYTRAELGFDALKNADAAVADVLVAAAEQAECEIYLALVSIEETGTAEHTYYGGRKRRWSNDDDEDFEIDEVYEREENVSEWRCPNGSRPPLATLLPFSEDELCPTDAFEDMEPDDVVFHEATGNEGASFDRTYSRAALVIWPKARHLAILNQAGRPTTLPFLEELSQRWEACGEGFDSPLWYDAHTLAGYMLRDWSEVRGPAWKYQEPVRKEPTAFLTHLHRLRDSERIDAFLVEVSAAGNYGTEDNEALAKAAALLPQARAAELLKQIIEENGEKDPPACADLLARFSAAFTQPGTLAPAAEAFLTVLPGDPARSSTLDRWRRPMLNANVVIDLLRALSAIDTAVARRAVEHVLAWPDTYTLNGMLVPAVLHLTEEKATRSLPAVERLREHVNTQLRTRVEQALQPPADWKRDSRISCRCGDCQELSRFLADPEQEVWNFKNLKAKRKHLESSIQRNQCDVDCVTRRSGSPHTLVCTKNQASYERRAKAHNQDLENLKRLEV